MCTTRAFSIPADEAGRKLARLMEKQLGYPEGHIDNIALRLFIRAYWDRVASLAHIIHGEGEPPPQRVVHVPPEESGVFL